LTTTQDQAAVNLQLIYALKPANAAHRDALLDQVEENQKIVFKNTAAILGREKDTRVGIPLTSIPTEWGAETDITRVKVYNQTPFDGLDPDPGTVSRWLSKMLLLGKTLTKKSMVSFLIQHATGPAFEILLQLQTENKELEEVVEVLETQFGDLMTKDEALRECNKMERDHSKPLPVFIMKLRHMAKVACRYEPDLDKRGKMVDQIVVDNITRALKPSVQAALTERILTRQRNGNRDFLARELERECINLDKARTAKREEIMKDLSTKYAKNRFVSQTGAYAIQDASSWDQVSLNSRSNPYPGEEYDTSSGARQLVNFSPTASSDEDEEEASREIFLARQIHRERNKFVAAGAPIDERKVMKGAVNKYNQRYSRPPRKLVGEVAYQQPQAKEDAPPRVYPSRPQHAPAVPHRTPAQVPYQQPMATPVGTYPPDAIRDPRNRPIQELISLSKCVRGQCIQCGLTGHLMGRDACPLKDKPLVSAPCIACGQGLHASNDCVRIFQNQQINQAADYAEALYELHLNE